MKIGEGKMELWTVTAEKFNGSTYTTKEEALREAEKNFYSGDASADELYVIFNNYLDFDWKELLGWAFKQTNFYIDFSDTIEKAVEEYTNSHVYNITIGD